MIRRLYSCSRGDKAAASPLKLQATAAVVLGLVLSVWMVASYRKSPSHFRLTGSTMGTEYSITYHHGSAQGVASMDEAIRPQALKLVVDEMLAEFNSYLSTYIEDSQISRFNEQRGLQPMVVHGDLLSITQQAYELFVMSEGAYDPTISPLIDLWGFGAGSPPRTSPPKPKEVRAAQQLSGFAKLRIDASRSTLQKTIPELQLNLSSIAKGFAVDKLAELMAARGILNYLVEIGGDLRAQGTNERGARWSIGIETPTTHTLGSAIRTLHLDQMSLASSGSYRNAFRHEDQQYSHIIDPVTGYPVQHHTVAVTVMAENCVTADGLATVLLILGLERGMALAVQHDMAALFIHNLAADAPDASPQFQISTTPAWDGLTAT